jgi:Tfp pilus assembly protein PilV
MTLPPPPPRTRGASLIEAILAVGVIAMAVPIVLATLVESGESGLSSQAETRCSWVIPACFDELQATREGAGRFLPATQPGQPFPGSGEVWALAFSADGRTLGKVSPADYQKGLKRLANTPVRYLATVQGTPTPATPGTTPRVNVAITLEFPAAAPAAKRSKIPFHTRLP